VLTYTEKPSLLVTALKQACLCSLVSKPEHAYLQCRHTELYYLTHICSCYINNWKTYQHVKNVGGNACCHANIVKFIHFKMEVSTHAKILNAW